MSFPGIGEQALNEKGAFWTATEVAQQPAMLRQTHEQVRHRWSDIDAFLRPLLKQDRIRIILTGAGSSAFIGECLAPLLTRLLNRRVEAISTTDICASPHSYLKRNEPTLLVSFARSGNSPESVAVLELTDNLVQTVHHLVITCNKDGALMERADYTVRHFAFLTPEGTNDRGFAMTSSFSSMLYAGYAVFHGPDALDPCIDRIVAASQSVLDEYAMMMRSIVGASYSRTVFLGSGCFKGLAQECALKLLELTDGQQVTAFDSPLGFRHGPKVIVNPETLVFLFVSNDPYTRQYDLDLLRELEEESAGRVIAVAARSVAGWDERKHIIIRDMEDAADGELLVPYIIGPQVFAFYQSLYMDRQPDNPNETGTVNRVVQGVRIHEMI
jgi:tagatose-6-phosphate ketose/aldose isomerase